MNYLEEKIMRDGVILPGNVLKVDSFLNHQVDIDAMRFMAQELQRRFEGVKITKILTIEASGIAIATMLAHYLHVPFVFAKKCLTINSIDDKYVSHAFSFTENRRHSVYVSKPYLSPADHVLVVDDFLAESEPCGVNSHHQRDGYQDANHQVRRSRVKVGNVKNPSYQYPSCIPQRWLLAGSSTYQTAA